MYEGVINSRECHCSAVALIAVPTGLLPLQVIEGHPLQPLVAPAAPEAGRVELLVNSGQHSAHHGLSTHGTGILRLLEVFLTDEFPAFLGDVVAGDGVATDAAGEALGVEGAAHHTHRSGLERLTARGTFGKSNLLVIFAIVIPTYFEIVGGEPEEGMIITEHPYPPPTCTRTGDRESTPRDNNHLPQTLSSL